jgi:hypothetical protein
MVEFDPRFTQTLYLDTEWYVPPGERTAGTGSLIVNPARSTHALLGGVFVREFPLQGRRLPPEEIWGFDLAGEDETLRSVYRLFERAWGEIAGRKAEHPDLVVVGIGVSRFDLPALFTRCLVRQIDRPERLFETFFHTKPVDLADFGAVGGTPAVRVLYPRTANQLRRARRPGPRKSSGTSVWRMFDEGRFDSIRARTRAEVEEVIALAQELLARPPPAAGEGEAAPP